MTIDAPKRTLRMRAISLYESEVETFRAQSIEWDATEMDARVAERLLETLLAMESDVARDELRSMVSGWRHTHEVSRAKRTFPLAAMFPSPDHIFVLGNGVRVFAQDMNQRHVTQRVREVSKVLADHTRSSHHELDMLTRASDALAEAGPGATLADVGALAGIDDVS